MNLVLELAEIEKQVSALISENINLKKENKELTEQNTSFLTSVENLNKSVQELEKENAELKDYRLTTLAKQQTDMSKYALNLEHKLSWYDDQLTKAKELLNEFLDFESSCMERGIYISDKIRTEAEQFINEVEK